MTEQMFDVQIWACAPLLDRAILTPLLPHDDCILSRLATYYPTAIAKPDFERSQQLLLSECWKASYLACPVTNYHLAESQT